MQRSYLDYAMSVIVSRALPDVRDGLKPVHRRVLYAMYDGGYRPDRGFSKCSRVVGDVMGQYHPHGDTAIYDALVRLAQPWALRYPLVHGQGNFGSPGNDPAAAMRYTECRMAPLAMEMVRDIDEETVDFRPNYDGRSQEPTVLPAVSRTCSSTVRPVSRSAWRPTSRRTTCARSPSGARWALEHPEASREEMAGRAGRAGPGPRFADRRPHRGREGIEDAYRTGRGIIILRAVVEVRGKSKAHLLSLPSCRIMVNPDNLAMKIADLVDYGKVQGISDVRDDSSGVPVSAWSSS